MNESDDTAAALGVGAEPPDSHGPRGRGQRGRQRRRAWLDGVGGGTHLTQAPAPGTERQPPPRSCERTSPPTQPLPSQPRSSRKLWELGSRGTLTACRRGVDAFLPRGWSLRPGRGARPKEPGEGPRLWLPQAPTKAEWAGGAPVVANRGALGGTSHLCPHQKTKNKKTTVKT